MSAINSPTPPTAAPAAVTGVQLMRGIGVRASRGFWVEVLASVLKRRGAVVGLCWLGLVLTLAILAPFIANGHPLVMRELDASGAPARVTYPFLNYLKPTDLLLPAWAVIVLVWCVVPAAAGVGKGAERTLTRAAAVVGGGGLILSVILAFTGVTLPIFVTFGLGGLVLGAMVRTVPRSDRFGILFVLALVTGLMVVISEALIGYLGQREIPDWARALKARPMIRFEAAGLITLAIAAVAMFIPLPGGVTRRVALFAATALLSGAAISATWSRPLATFDYRTREAQGQVQCTYAIVPWSPNQRRTELVAAAPGTRFWEATGQTRPAGADDPTFVIGTDAQGQDVLSQMIHACRLSISIGLVSTGISVLIGVTIGSLMGYFGGWIDILLYRMVEVFMAVPVLFLLIVAAAVLPRNIYYLMAIIGCFTWMGSARFIRAEFMKMRNQDFVQAARAVGLPLHSILFRHMLPNGVTPVLVDASFAIAAAILAETTLSYLGLGPEGQPSWGLLLSDATGQTGTFLWWLATFPGLAIFLTVLSYNLIGEALRDAIDPKLKKARV